MWTFGVMNYGKSVIPFDVFIQQFLSVFPADSTMYPDLCLEVRK